MTKKITFQSHCKRAFKGCILSECITWENGKQYFGKKPLTWICKVHSIKRHSVSKTAEIRKASKITSKWFIFRGMRAWWFGFFFFLFLIKAQVGIAASTLHFCFNSATDILVILRKSLRNAFHQHVFLWSTAEMFADRATSGNMVQLKNRISFIWSEANVGVGLRGKENIESFSFCESEFFFFLS